MHNVLKTSVVTFITAMVLPDNLPQATQVSRSTSFFSTVYPEMGDPPSSSGFFQDNLQPVGFTPLISKKPLGAVGGARTSNLISNSSRPTEFFTRM